MDKGNRKGDVCGRDGCEGIIDEHEKEGSCSCHINPPCSKCTTDTSYCPVCDWTPDDDIVSIDTEAQKKQAEYYKKQNEIWQEARDSFYKKYNGQEAIVELEMRTEPHTHFTQIVVGVFPEGTQTKESLLPEVEGTFGGRFEIFGTTKFKYIAYTD